MARSLDAEVDSSDPEVRALLARRTLPRRILAALCLVGLLLMGGCGMALRMPGRSFQGALPALTPGEEALRRSLRRDVEALAIDIGERNVHHPAQLAEAAAFVEKQLALAGFVVKRQTFTVRGVPCHNLEVEIRGREKPDEILVVGAHYDSVIGTPGANDNGSGTAALLALARAFAGQSPARTVRFVAFVNEEPPWFLGPDMGSLVYAKACRARGDKVVGMLSLETLGFFRDEEGSQKYPPPLSLFYPSRGDFVAFVGDLSSRGFVKQVVDSFRRQVRFPSEGATLPASIPGVGWSDHWSFWQVGYPGVMVTDTAPFRYPHYHTADDTPDKIDYDRLARVVAGLEKVLLELAGAIPR